MGNKKIFFLLLSISLIICQGEGKVGKKVETTKEKQKNEEMKKEEQIEIKDEENIKGDINQTEEINEEAGKKSSTRKNFDSKNPFNMTINEMDTMMVCAIIVQESIRDSRKDLENLQKKINASNINFIYEKVGTDIFEKCNLKLDIKTVNRYIKNLTLVNNFVFEEEFKEISKIDYDKYQNETNLGLSMEQQILLYKYQKVDELFRQKKADERNFSDKNYEREKIKIGKLDLESIPSSMKISFFLFILIAFFGGVFYLLKKLERKPKDKKKKEKKKKSQ